MFFEECALHQLLPKRDHGFTLIQLVVALAMGGILVAVMADFSGTFFQSLTGLDSRADGEATWHSFTDRLAKLLQTRTPSVPLMQDTCTLPPPKGPCLRFGRRIQEKGGKENVEHLTLKQSCEDLSPQVQGAIAGIPDGIQVLGRGIAGCGQTCPSRTRAVVTLESIVNGQKIIQQFPPKMQGSGRNLLAMPVCFSLSSQNAPIVNVRGEAVYRQGESLKRQRFERSIMSKTTSSVEWVTPIP